MRFEEYIDTLVELNIVMDAEWELKFYNICSPARIKLNPNGYPWVWGVTKYELLHRIVLNTRDGQIADHINGDPTDMRTCNLRIVSIAQNSFNTKNYKTNTSSKKGVSFDDLSGRWSAEIRCRHKRYRKKFKDFDKAVAWRDKMEMSLYGIYARRL